MKIQFLKKGVCFTFCISVTNACLNADSFSFIFFLFYNNFINIKTEFSSNLCESSFSDESCNAMNR